MKKLNYLKFVLDLLLVITFLLLFNDRVLGGLVFHEIAGIAIGAAFLIHILLNWKWVVKITTRLFNKNLPNKTRLGYFLNILLLVGMTFIILSGIFISRIVFPDIDIPNQRWFSGTHRSVTFVTLVIAGIHVGLHWKWVILTLKKIFHVQRISLGWFRRVLSVSLTLLFLAFGAVQISETDYIDKLGMIDNFFPIPSFVAVQAAEPDFWDRGERSFDHSRDVEFPEGESPDLERGTEATSAEQERPEFDRPGNFDFSERERSPRDRHRGRGDANPVDVVVSYLGVMGVFIIATTSVETVITRLRKIRKR